MNPDDPFSPFGDEDKTVIRPTPGGRRRPSPAAADNRVAESPLPPTRGTDVSSRRSFDDNPLTCSAAHLFSLASRLRRTAIPPDIADLQRELVAAIRAFETDALRQGITERQTGIATYAICSLLDETILNTPWGADSNWGHQSLLVLFHKEAWGGEKFFDLLKQLVQQPTQNLPLLEFFFLCLSFGFEGKYRIAAGGANALEQMRAELFRLIGCVRTEPEHELSPRWQGLRDLRPAIIRYVPLWVVAASAAALLVVVYLGYLFAINSASDPVFSRLSGLANTELTMAETAPVMPALASAERFKRLLTSEMARGLVEVPNDRTLRIYNSFPSGSAQVKPEFIPLLRKIAQEFQQGGDRVVVTGHTDDKPIRSARFPSNFDLSNARARNVAEILSDSAGIAGKVRYEGHADSDPLVPNDSAEHRGINRRVDILIK